MTTESTEAPILNVELINTCLDNIVAEPKKWDQGSWSSGWIITKVPKAMLPKVVKGAESMCGTTACLAGQAMLASGEWRTVITTVEKVKDQNQADNASAEQWYGKKNWKVDDVLSYDVDFQNVESNQWPSDYLNKGDTDDACLVIAQELLGLTFEQAHYLFITISDRSWTPKGFAKHVRNYLHITSA